MAEISREVFAAYAQSFPQSRLGRQLLRLVSHTGFRNVKSVPRIVRPPYERFRRSIDGFLRSSIAKARLAEADVTRWLEGLAQAEAGNVFNYGVTVFSVCGEKP
jgi:hypothetical protein